MSEMIELHWLALAGLLIGAFAFGVGTGFRIDRKWSEELMERVVNAEIREERIRAEESTE